MSSEPERTVAWHLMIFDQKSEYLVTEVELTAEQIDALKPFLGIVGNDQHFGSYPLSGVDVFAEEHVK